MAAQKRKNDLASDKRPDKKPKSAKHSDEPRIPTTVLREEEEAFPRGGRSVLTPLEKRQIQIKAKQDVLFEQSTGKKAPADSGDEHDDDDDDDDGNELPEANESIATIASKTKNSGTSSKKKTKLAKHGNSPELRVKGLSYKRLAQGSVVLGQVSSINKYDVTIALPNNLIGYVPLTAVSDRATQTIEEIAAEQESDDEAGGPSEEIKEFSLRDYVRTDQYVRAYVTAVGSEDKGEKKGNKHHVTLSLMPEHANSGLAGTDMVINNVVQASVQSVEDHGLVMNLGIAGANVKGFMGSRELPAQLEIASVKPGAIFLCLITGLASGGKIVKLSANEQKLGGIKKGAFLTDAPSVDSFQPGCAVEVLISAVTSDGIIGKAMGLLDVTADIIHCAAHVDKTPLSKRFAVGMKVKARVICNFPTLEGKRIGVSVLPHMLSLSVSHGTNSQELLSVSTIVESARVKAVEPGVGIFLDVGSKDLQGFAHISRLSDEKVKDISATSGPYKIGSAHRARVVGYNPIDGLYLLSLEQSVLDLPFLNVTDITPGQIVKATVEKFLTTKSGQTSILLRLTHHIDGLVPEMHISDVQLQNPEKKYKVGTKVSARVLSVDLESRRLKLTLKKSLVNSDAAVWTSYTDAAVGAQSIGTIVKILPSGAVVQYYGNVRGFLPASQMSETFIKDPGQHFRVGQVISTHVLSVEADDEKLLVSCRDPSSFGPQQQTAYDGLQVGATVSGAVSEKTSEEIVLEVGKAKIKAILPIEHLADGSAQKCLHAAKRIRVGQTLQDLLILSKHDNKHMINLSSKPALLKAIRDGSFPSSINQLEIGQEVIGFVRNVADTAVFVQFAGNLVGLLPRTQLTDLALELPQFGLRRNATITSKVKSIDSSQERFVLTQKEAEAPASEAASAKRASSKDAVKSDLGFELGTITKAKISSVKESQLNVTLDGSVQGRVDISQIFQSLEEIEDRKRPLNKFKPNEEIQVRVIGAHNHRNHKFLPITHAGRTHVLELTAKRSDLVSSDFDVLTLDKLQDGKEYLCFVNNIIGDNLWVNLSPNVRGRIRAIDASDDTSILSNLEDNFPPGSALRARVIHVDTPNNRLDLSARLGTTEAPKSLAELSVGSILPGKVTGISETSVRVHLSDNMVGTIPLVEMADDFSKASPNDFDKNQIIRVQVARVDVPNKKLVLSARPSKVLSSSLPVVDKDYQSLDQLEVNNIVRGFIKNVADVGIFVALSSTVTGFIRVSDLSDMFIKDWKAQFEVDKLVRAKVIAVDPSSNHLQLSLKQSIIDNKDFQPSITMRDLKVGQHVTGKVRKVEDFGVFVVIDNSSNVSGLCHRSELADEPVSDVKSLYSAGDPVKAKVLKVDIDKRRVAFGLKASYFADEQNRMLIDGDSDEDSSDFDSEDGSEMMDRLHGVSLAAQENDEMSDLDEADSSNIRDIDESNSDKEPQTVKSNGASLATPSISSLTINGSEGLNLGRYNWDAADGDEKDSSSESDSGVDLSKRKKRRKAPIQVDRTADLDVNGPQTATDFERLLMSEPNSSYLWLSYMAYYLQINEIARAREIAERAIKTVNHQRKDTEDEALNVWVGYLNLENTYGTEETVKKIFSRATQYNDAEEVYVRLASIWIQSKKTDLADELFQSMVRKFSQDPKIWLNYADFLFDTVKEPSRGRDLLPRALQALPKHHHLDLTTKFAQLEFKSPNGDSERGRTMFEGLIDTYPKRLDLFNILLDLEQKNDDLDRVRRLYQRATSGKLKPKQAKYFFKRWLEFEEAQGDSKGLAKVKARAEDYARKHQEKETED